MSRMIFVLWSVALLAARVHGAELPPYKRMLAGDDAKKATTLQKRIDDLWAAGKFKEAVGPAEELLALRKRVQGKEHWEIADAARQVQSLHKAAALPLGKQAMLARVPAIAAKAGTLHSRNKLKEAESLYRKALAVVEAALGACHPETATSYSILAYNLDAQGRAKEAEPLHRKALAVHEAELGAHHPDTARSYNNLAYNLDAQGRAKEAEPLLRKALAVSNAVQGPRHPHTAMGYNNLAMNLQAQGRTKEVEPLLRKALIVREAVLDPRHPQTASSYNNLASNLQAQGRAKEAEPLYRKALAVFEAVLGPRHPDTATSYSSLAYNLDAQGRAKEAEPLLRKALAVYEAELGPRHPHTATSYNNLASNLHAQGRTREAEPLYRKALIVREAVLGPRHPDTAGSCNNLASNLHAQGQAKEAELLYRKALVVNEAELGFHHPHTASSYNHLAHNLQAQGRTREAEPLWQASVDGVEGARLRLAASSLNKALALDFHPHFGLASCRARLGRSGDAWVAAEAGLARGLLDDLAARTALPNPEVQRRDREHAARLDRLDKLLTPLLVREKLSAADQRRRDDLLKERKALDDETARVAAERSRRAVLPLKDIQAQLAPDDAFVFWMDASSLGDHWGCVVRRAGPPAWVRLSGSGDKDKWMTADDKLPRLLRDDLANGEPSAAVHARRLAAQRLKPLAPHLAGARRLIVVPVGVMAGVPVEVLTERYLVSYAPSGTVFARLRAKHRPLRDPTLLALGDPAFTPPRAGPLPTPPDHGLYLTLVLPDGNAGRAGLRAGDVLLRYGATKLTTRADLKLTTGTGRVPIVVWRDGKTLNDLRLAPGRLGVVVSSDTPAVALRKRRELDLLADSRTRDEARPLPGTRLEVAAIAGLLPEGRSTLLLGSRASEQELDALAAAKKLKDFRLLHLATHGTIDPVSSARSSLLLARDRLPGPDEQARRAVAGKKVYTGRLSVETILDTWDLDADLVTLSACQTAVGRDGGGEGLLGFSQALLGHGARSLLLSLWKVDDTATALLMTRFYENLLGKRAGLKTPMPKAEALREAKRWLRTLPQAEVEKLAARLAKGVVRAGLVRATEEPKSPLPPREVRTPPVPQGKMPFAHPRYWAAFILIGDPD